MDSPQFCLKIEILNLSFIIITLSLIGKKIMNFIWGCFVFTLELYNEF